LTCRLYNNIVVPSLIAPNSNYYLFKEGIKPAWEDSANAKGGKWSVQLPRGKFSAEIDQYWLFTVSQYFVKPPIPASC
jgi:translation initiation factor 4E